VVRYQQILGDAVLLRSEVVDDAQLMSIQLSGSGDQRQLTEFTVALFCRCISAILDRPWVPESVHFPHPPPKDMRVHARVFPCSIDFDSDFVGIVCAQSALQQRNPAGDKELVAHAEHFLALVAPPRTDSVSERVRRALRLLLPDQRGTIEDVARHMGTGARTLQRQLGREQKTFAALLNEVRREHALRHLSQAHPLSMVAQMVGYRGVSSFTRWFNAEFGMPPAAGRGRPLEDEG
jgi:AraC-like DNA-binding protein